MQSITSTQQAVLDSNYREVIYKVNIFRNEAPSTPIDLTPYVISLSLSGDLESRTVMCRLVLKNEDFQLSPHNQTSPLNQYNGSYNPLLFPNHKLTVHIGFNTSIGEEYWQLFTGITGDEISPDIMSGTITISVRDYSKRLLDSYVYLSKSYDYLVIEDVISQFLVERGLSDIVFQSEITNFLIQHFQVKDSNVWAEIQKLSDLMGWILMFNETGVLVLKNVKSSSAPDITFDEDDIIIEQLSITDADVRNDIWIRTQTPDGIIVAFARDYNSINQFGRRFMLIDRSLASYIWSYDQAYNLACAILRDLSVLPYTNRIELPIFPPIQLDDIVAIQSTKSGITTTELFKVINFEHNISENSKRTTLTLKKYVPPVTETVKTPNPPTSLVASIINYQISNYPNSGWIGDKKTTYYPKITFVKPTTNTDGSPLTDLQGYILERSTDNVNYLPIRYFSAKNYIGNDQLHIIDYSCPSGTYYFRLSSVNAKGKKSSPSSSISVNVPNPLIE